MVVAFASPEPGCLVCEEAEYFACNGEAATGVSDGANAGGHVAARDEPHLGVQDESIYYIVTELLDSPAISRVVEVHKKLLLP